MDILDGEQGMISTVGIGHNFLIKTAESTIQEAFFGRERSFDSDSICKLGIASRPCTYQCPSSCLPLPSISSQAARRLRSSLLPCCQVCQLLELPQLTTGTDLVGILPCLLLPNEFYFTQSLVSAFFFQKETCPMRIKNLGNLPANKSTQRFS